MFEMNRLAALFLQFESNGDEENAEKVKQLIEKVQNNEFIIGFCGHFSAGKSTMMNRLMGKEVLPSSPIPTSANLVKIKKGKSYARVYYKERNPVEFLAPYDYEVVKSFCKDGETISGIEISDEEIKLPAGVSIMDTPGIDSTDDAHRIATESALHLADLILYVMDYNHVQSEENFTFTKMLKDRGKPVYIVINMIDKHNEDELSFTDYKATVSEAFKQWGVEIDGVFYTSLKDFRHPENRYLELERFLSNQMTKKNELIETSVRQSISPLIDEHLHRFDAQHDQFIQQFELELERLPEDERKLVVDEVAELEEKQHSLLDQREHLKDQFEIQIKKILDNAYLMPAATRELAHSYIEACQTDFKVGFLFSKKKTAEEREERLRAFFDSLKKQVDAQLDWHITDFMIKFFKENGIESTEFSNSIYEDVPVKFEPDLLSKLVKSGAGLTGDYILNYTNDVASELKQLYRKSSLAKLEEGKSLLDTALDDELAIINKQLAKYTEFKQAIIGLGSILQKRKNLEDLLVGILNEPLDSEVIIQAENWLQIEAEKQPIFDVKTMEVSNDPANLQQVEGQLPIVETVIESELKNGNEPAYNVRDRLNHTVHKLRTSMSLLEGIKGMHSIANDMKLKAHRLEDNRFTIALFGAFSAGKSSFANALIGEKLLPVSPNPTTATINKILPADHDHPHGTVIVKIKTKEQIYKDVEHSLSLFHEQCDSMDEAIGIIRSLSYDGHDVKEKPHYSFLKAVLTGYDFISDKLGNELHVELALFEEYVAIEEKSCFVEWIELYYDCPLTNEGVTLVDTPGADSINARHTGVAFEYIKNADAILFVTYYNHAFSKADREFLIQLGRVKEAFEMDKMYFVINAADLAKSEEDLKIVVDYVGDELQKYGIRFPRIYPLSSKLALEEKLSNTIDSETTESRIMPFEHALHSFISNDLAELSIQSAHEDLKRATVSLENMIKIAQESEEIKQQKQKLGEATRTQILDYINTKEFVVEHHSLQKEIKELVFYIGQRVFFRYNDFYNEAFNPSALRDDGRDLKKALHNCLDELIETIGFDLVQEMRATTLRIENYLNKLMKEAHQTIKEATENIHKPIQLRPFEAKKFKPIDFENALTNLSKDPLKAKLALFKGTKLFFEQGGKAKLKEELESLLKQPIHSYLEEQSITLKNMYSTELNEKLQQYIGTLEDEVHDYYEGYFSALTDSIDVDKLESVIKELELVLK